MAETSYLWDNPGTGDSPGGGYGNATLNQVIFRMLLNGTGNQGVLNGWLNELAVTDGGGLNAAVDTGGALCYGVWYESDAATNVAIANNSTEWVVVRASWAAQTSRLVAIAPGAFTQVAGVTYDIPLAEVTTVAGAITLITDLRDFCEFSTDVWPFGVETAMIAADAVTIGKLVDHDRWFLLGAGSPAPDGTNPAAWTAVTGWARNEWVYTDGVTNALWVTVRVPADISSATLSIRVWDCPRTAAVVGDVRWLYNLWQAAAGAVAANTAGNTVQTLIAVGAPFHWQEFTILNQAVTAGDLIHLQLSRDGGHGADTLLSDLILHGVYFYYTADN